MKIGIIKEGKIPPDKRVPLSPAQCAQLMEKYPGLEVEVQSSNIRCFADSEYKDAGAKVIDNVSGCDVLMGVKEVPVDDLVPDRTYLFFSHTIKEQPYNKKLLQTVLRKNIQLVDYECLENKEGFRLLGFGRYAGIVGTYDGLYAWGQRFDSFNLKRAYQCEDRSEMESELEKVTLPNIKIILTGGGRVAQGAMEVLDRTPIRKVSPEEFLSDEFDEPVYCQMDVDEYCRNKQGRAFDFQHFFAHPKEYESIFLRYTEVADMYIACHFWAPDSPIYFSREDMQRPDFNIKVVADISCDIDGPIASTIRPSTIEEPHYGYDPVTGEEVEFDKEGAVTVMAVDNLPCELPKDASEDFGGALIGKVIPHLLGDDPDKIIERACIAKDGKLMPEFEYLDNYVRG